MLPRTERINKQHEVDSVQSEPLLPLTCRVASQSKGSAILLCCKDLLYLLG